MKSQIVNPKLLSCLAFGIFLVFGCSEEEIESRQLLKNGDVEIGSIAPNNWWNNNNGSDVFLLNWSDQQSFSGSKSLRTSAQTPDPDNFAIWAQTISTDLPTGMDITLRAKIKGDLTGDGVSIVIRGDDTVEPSGRAEQFATSQQTSNISGDFEWSEYSIKLADIDDGIKSLTVYLIFLENTTGEVYFDDISLTY